MTITIDRRIYNDSVISKAIYWLSGDYIIVRSILDDNTESLSITANNANIAKDSMKTKLMQTLNDFKLRQIVEKGRCMAWRSEMLSVWAQSL